MISRRTLLASVAVLPILGKFPTHLTPKPPNRGDGGPGYVPPDPVAYHDGAWWHVDEVWCDEFGPFDTEAEARDHLDRYCEFLENGPPREV